MMMIIRGIINSKLICRLIHIPTHGYEEMARIVPIINVDEEIL